MRMLAFLCAVILCSAFSCQETKDEMIETWWINSAKVECTGVGPMQCLQIQKSEELEPDKWLLFYDQIEGFDYQPGSIYQIKVKVTDKQEPIPADASSKNYELIEVISQESDPKLRLTNVWKLTKVGEIENPTHPRNQEALTFEFNASEGTYFGNAGCNTVRGEITQNDGEKLTLGAGAMTRMACMDMTVENAVTQALPQVSSYTITERKLQLKDASGAILMEFLAVD